MMKSALISLSLLLGCSLLTAAEKPEVASLEKIWDQGKHNAFTDLIRWQDKWWCTFREADAHVGGDGQARVLVSTDGKTWESAALISAPQAMGSVGAVSRT